MTSDTQIIIAETVEKFCDKFCKYSGSGDDNGCEYCQEHDGECPFDRMLDEIGLK